MKILIAQIKPKIGDLKYNCDKIKQYYNFALEKKIDILLLPELMISGYLCKDLFLQRAFLQSIEEYIEKLKNYTKNTVLLLSTPIYKNHKLYNGVIAFQNSTLIGYTTKKHLPNYKLFDEKRYFEPGNSKIIRINGISVGIPICEDLWFNDVGRKLKSLDAKILLVPNASPYEKNKLKQRIKKADICFKENNLPILYCNQVSGQEGVIFDGQSFVYETKIQHMLKPFVEETVTYQFVYEDIQKNNLISKKINKNFPNKSLKSNDDFIYSAIILAFRDYLMDNNFYSVVIGISGGIDSAFTSLIAVDALGAKNVTLVMLPSKFTSKENLEDAQSLSRNLNVKYQIIDIMDILNITTNTLSNISITAYENLQARIRGNILMTIANSTNSLLIGTSNKSELAVGYTTIYGDMCSGFNPIKDLYKTEIYRLAKFRNRKIPTLIRTYNNTKSLIPNRIFTKAPSAELNYDQKDSDYLPDYNILDKILKLYIEKNYGIHKLINKGYDKHLLERIITLIKKSEFKRQQSAIGIKISNLSFDKEHRFPITNHYKETM